ncbi:hypothetical protein ACH49L_45885, partial [Streptomyces olivaceoviridis]
MAAAISGAARSVVGVEDWVLCLSGVAGVVPDVLIVVAVGWAGTVVSVLVAAPVGRGGVWGAVGV